MINYQNINKKYGNHKAVIDFNLEVNKGELIILIGPSGCGKTTTLKMTNRLIKPTSGKIYVKGEDTDKINPVDLRRSIGYVIQEIALFPHMSVEDNITVVPKLLGWPPKRRRERAYELLNLVAMNPKIYAKRYPAELSGGQQQRIGVLRALAADVDIILMDEPFGSLDPITRSQLQDEFKNLQEKLHKTIIFVTHDMDEALKMADRIVLMRSGKIVQIDTPDMILRSPADSFVKDFIGKDRLTRSPDEVLVNEVMYTDPITIRPRQGLAEALQRMKSRHVNGLIVVDSDHKFLGIVTLRKLQENIEEKGKSVENIMTTSSTIGENQTMREAVKIMADARIEYLPVVDDQKKLKGLITRASLVDILLDHIWIEEGEKKE
ncbi:MAG: ABC transporter ATP-binding protein [Caldisericia bacterium]|nr:ABC transporter ATP-binding protein [Actinomycetota bacterium]MDD5689425.1 ABC transporter ATP-binding protein [Caldisericia bacterium]